MALRGSAVRIRLAPFSGKLYSSGFCGTTSINCPKMTVNACNFSWTINACQFSSCTNQDFGCTIRLFYRSFLTTAKPLRRQAFPLVGALEDT